MKITITTEERYGRTGFNVECDGKTSGNNDPLSFDEMLAVVVALTGRHALHTLSWLKTPEEHAADEHRRDMMIYRREAVNPTEPICGM
jgi:hypothetical protein